MTVEKQRENVISARNPGLNAQKVHHEFGFPKGEGRESGRVVVYFSGIRLREQLPVSHSSFQVRVDSRGMSIDLML